jgi:hypothetical protein
MDVNKHERPSNITLRHKLKWYKNYSAQILKQTWNTNLDFIFTFDLLKHYNNKIMDLKVMLIVKDCEYRTPSCNQFCP